ncbi:hypothetical protein BBK36DRAFT_1196681 [Trichoderma citrinoviride]|uniref:LPXTG-motif cell wall anchor domain protein n=1 Tax=Trichoderma citrinoviride TaxID=58853 RepID=A0A2T4BDP4_9HYPO|nr:hypothetical protein BBK36DRAFT_1196681 [Trichoderma citrinoviride]PTB67446.1 hypothetical protein BBK36DRAFT_1196681 [Trichoderma citrinoviride]
MTETASFAAARSTAASLPGKTLAGAAPPSITGPSSNLHSHRQSHNSSKLPSFRFADIKNAPNAAAQPSSSSSSSRQPQHQHQSLPLSPRRLAPPAASIDSHLDRRESRTRPDSLNKILASSATARNRQSLPAPEKPASPPRPSLRPRASYQTSVKAIVEQERRVRRPVSFPDGLADEAAQAKLSSLARTSSLKQSTRRLPASRTTSNANGRVTPDGPRTSLSTRQPAIEDAVSPTTRVAADPKPLGLRLRARNLPDSPASKQPSLAGPSDENQDQPLQRPPVSYKPSVNGAATAGQSTASTTTSRVPPSRASRSSGSRHSSVDEMNYSSRSSYDEDRYVDSTDDHTLRASDGDFFDQRSPPTSRHGTNGDDTGDVFMKIASEEAARHSAADNANDPNSSSQFRVNRTSSRRPLSQNVSSYYPMSPPSSINRRLSDQQDRERSRSVRYEDELTSEIARSSAYRSQLRDKAISSRAAEDTPSRSTSSGLRPSPMTPRSTGLHDQAVDSVLYGRRKSTVVDAPASSSARSSAHKATVLVQNHTKAYNPSPLNRSFEMQEEDDGADAGNLAEGTESTTSTNAPSTVWDELDELKSRIHRLELTGKLPPTSAAAVIKASEERPPTATTTVTTMSLSPRKSAAGQQTDAGSSTTSSQREAHTNLHSALSKIKQILSPEVYRALETAANDALALSSMMGSASVVGGGGSGITDRQLRRRTDSVCRSLTELCIALGEGGTSRPTTGIPQVVTTQLSPNPNSHSQLEPPRTPTMLNTKTYSVSRRSSVVPEQATQVISSPRATSKYEERRNMILSGSNILTSPRASASTPTTPNESISRRASLIVSRARRAVTEEAEDGRRSSALLRRRAAGDESDEGGRRTSFLEDEGARFRAPSRAITEVNGGSRGATREYLNASDAATPMPEGGTTPQPPSALSRRRFLQPSRLTVPSTSTTPSTRKFLERPAADGGESGPERPSENRLSRHLSVQHASNHSSAYHSLQNRTSSLQFRRTSTVPAASTTATNGLR